MTTLPENAEYANIKTPWGEALLIWSELGIHSCLFDTSQNISGLAENKVKGQQLFEDFTLNKSVKLSPSGTAFQQKVWKTLTRIPKSETRSYKWVAEQSGYTSGFQSIGQAVKMNPINLFIPCHRVIKSDGSLGGFRWGSKIKQQILDFEGQSQL